MIVELMLAASIASATPNVQSVRSTNAVSRVLRMCSRVKPTEELTPVEAWHRFCRPHGKVDIPKDTRPVPYKVEKPNQHKRKPRK